LVLLLPFGALVAWLDRMLMYTAAALTIGPLPILLAGVLEGRTADGRGDAHLGRRETRPQAASDWGTSMMRVEWYLTTRICANSVPLPPRGHEAAVEKPERILGRCWPAAVMAVSSEQCAGIMPNLLHAGLVGFGMARYLG
jgi:hypothetical protein